MTATSDSSDHLVTGVTIPLVTALDRRGRPDPPAVLPLLEHLAAGGITTLMLGGTNGEGPLLTATEVRDYATEVSAQWRDLAGEPARILVTVPGAGTRDTLRRLEILDDVRLDAVVALAPFYYRHGQSELHRHFREVATHGRPVIVYNSPGYTGNPVTASLLRGLLDEPGIVGVKDSSGDARLFARFCELAGERPGFGIAQGAERQLAAGLRAGAAGLVPGVGMLAPALCAGLFRAAVAGDHATAEARQHDVDQLTGLFTIRPGVSGVVIVKAALDLLGLCPPHAAPPFLPCTETELEQVRDLLRHTVLHPEPSS
ncbi:dihydrodipicolinate synthase family protein [Amycolatopsis endophytica]|uniref:4-hydroxy-tetrahydrodipicolinate synthase n=1 Tax=Amycolatopsis endophytica TaxID=860233 RepID=A0A853B9Q4_9PSEU|nr:dihydrodipicolinate synthase family protein [Amycolatopsis endophytica]NYI91421.1 4-hydroxy-tetrahydrodipicolinate synthase [Amycolatopsis endophytica]